MNAARSTQKTPHLRIAGEPGGSSMVPPGPRLPRIPETALLDHESSRTIILNNLDAAHNLAWWLTGNDHDAADVVQDACLKAFRTFQGFRGGDAKAWLLSIVRNTARDRRRGQRRDAEVEMELRDSPPPQPSSQDPLSQILGELDRAEIDAALRCLPEQYREVLVLRELEGLGYAQIAAVVDAPIGTVMSRLSRARDSMEAALRRARRKE